MGPLMGSLKYACIVFAFGDNRVAVAPVEAHKSIFLSAV
jgi:hypothetical protein